MFSENLKKIQESKDGQNIDVTFKKQIINLSYTELIKMISCLESELKEAKSNNSLMLKSQLDESTLSDLKLKAQDIENEAKARN
jgi:pheromone shutdown protein TraB